MKLEHIVAGLFLTQQGCLPSAPELAIPKYSVTAGDGSDIIHYDDTINVSMDAWSVFDPSKGTLTADFTVEGSSFPLTLGETRHRADYTTFFATSLSPQTFDVGNHLYNFIATYISRDETLSATLHYDVSFTVFDAEEVDCSAPTISLDAIPTTLLNNSSYDFTATVSATTEGCSVDSVTLTLDGTEYIMNLEFSSTYAATVDLSDLAMEASPEEKQYTVEALSGTAVNTETGYFTLEDVLAPEITATASPDPVDNLAGATLTIDATVTDIGTGVNSSQVYVELDDGIQRAMSFASPDLYTLDIAGNILTAPETSYTIHAFDNAGLEGTYTDTVAVNNVSGLTVHSLGLTPDTVSNATAETVTISYDVADEQDADGTLSTYCLLDDALLAYLIPISGTLYQATFDTTDFIVAQDYTLDCIAEDSDNNSIERSTILTVADGLAPVVYSGSTTVGHNDGSAPVTITLSAGDETASLLSINYSSALDTGTLTYLTGTYYQASLDVTGFAAGIYGIDFSISDGTNTTPYTLSATVGDYLAPSITGCSLSTASVTTPSGTTTVRCTIDEETAFDYAYVDGGALGTFLMTGAKGAYTATVNVSETTPAGTYSLTVDAFDAAGNSSSYTSLPSLFVIDGVEPSLDCAVSDAANDGSQDAEMQCIATDESGSVTVDYSSSALGTGSLANTSGDIFEASVSVSGIAASTDNVTFTATDDAGNDTSVVVSYTIEDLLFPTVTSCSLSDYTLTTPSDSTTAACYGLSDETGIHSVLVNIDALGEFPLTVTGSTATGTVALSSSSTAGTYGPVVEISDGANTTSYSLSTLTVRDGVAPELSCPATLTVYNDGTTSTLECTATDETAMDIVAYTSSLFGSGNLDYTGSDSYSADFSAYGEAAQSAEITVTAEDSTGNSAAATVAVSLEDRLSPSITSCDATPATISTPSGTTVFTAYIDEDTLISSATATVNSDIVYLTEDSSGVYVGEYSATASLPVGTYSVLFHSTDSAGNTALPCTDTLTVLDGIAPSILSAYASPDSIVDNSSESFTLYVCAEDETDGTYLGGDVSATVDTFIESLSYNSSTECFESRAIYGDEFSAGTYTIDFSAADAAGNIATDSATVEVTCTTVVIDNIQINYATSDAVIYNDNTPSTFTVSADISDGSCGALEPNSAYVTIDSITEAMTGSGTYTSGTFDAYADAASLRLGSQTVTVSAEDTTGNVTTETSTVTISSICDNLSADASGATVGVYTNGTYQASLSTSIPSKMSTVDTIRLGSYGAAFYSPLIMNYNGSFAEELDLSVCSGGSYSAGVFITSSYHDCSLSTTYNCTANPWSIAFELVGTTISGYLHTMEVNSSTAGGTGTNVYKASSDRLFRLNDGAGTGTTFADSSLSGDTILTICGNP